MSCIRVKIKFLSFDGFMLFGYAVYSSGCNYYGKYVKRMDIVGTDIDNIMLTFTKYKY